MASAGMFESHTSASLEDFEAHERPSLGLRYPTERSGFLRESSSSEAGNGGDSHSEGVPWSPQGWRGQSAIAGSGWYRHQPYMRDGSPLRSSVPSSSRSRDQSRRLGTADEDDPTLPANIPLPPGSQSPDKVLSRSPTRDHGTSPAPNVDPEDTSHDGGKEDDEAAPGGIGNYIRFAFRAEVQHRTEPIEWLVSFLQPHLDRPAKRRLSASVWMLLLALIVWPFLTRTPSNTPAPDLVKLAGLARSLEPLMYYSENGVQHLSELQETGVAVWDLGESVRVANMSGAPTIVRELDDLAESLQALSVQLTQFFPAVDSDIDNVLLVMEWAKRELAALSTAPTSTLAAAVTNVHSMCNYLGILENKGTGRPTYAGQALIYVFGMTPAQRSRTTLQRTFNELLGALEESIATELSRTAALFALFATIDGQFHNLQRVTVRELDAQEREESELLSSLWQRVMGANGQRLRKFERNRHILQSVRTRTVANKNLLVEHNGKLLALKESLETLRRRLMSPLVLGQGQGASGGAASSSAGLAEQIAGLDDTHTYLRAVRQAQRGKVMEKLYGPGNRVREQRRLEIEGRS